MAVKGNSYQIKLKESHIAWGTYRFTDSRPEILGEAYIPIPRHVAKKFNIFNSNYTGGLDILGQNIFDCVSMDGSFKGTLKAQGCSEAGDIYAKQFSIKGNLKALGIWFYNINASVGDIIEVEWISDTDIILNYIKKI